MGRNIVKERLINGGTSLLNVNSTVLLKLALFLKFTGNFNENVSKTCWSISIDTPHVGSSSEPPPFLDVFLPLDDLSDLAVFGQFFAV
jgi:hypothetical protein